MRYSFLMLLLFVACKGSIGGEGDTTFTQDNSVDNSVHGIADCSQDTSVVCDEEGNIWTVSTQCTAPSGDPVMVNGPDFFNQQPADCIFESDAEIDTDGDGDVEAVSTIDSGFSFDD